MSPHSPIRPTTRDATLREPGAPPASSLESSSGPLPGRPSEAADLAPTHQGPAADHASAHAQADERRRLAARVLIDALLLGIVGDALLRVSSWGANFTLWSMAIIAAMLTLGRRRLDALSPDARWISVPAIGLALAFVWRGSPSLAAYNALALAATIALLATAIARGPEFVVVRARVRDVVYSVARIGVGALFGMLPLVLSDVSFRDVAGARGSARLIAGIRAGLIAIPLLLVFGGLFASADPVFARIAGEAFRLDVEEVASHLMLSGIIAWLVGGFLRTTVLASGRGATVAWFPDGALGLAEVAVALGSLVLLFAAFVGVQLRYFLGGEALVQVTAGMSYADYARRGFFELVTVSALVLPVLLAASALLRRDTPRADRVYRVLAGTLIALLAVIMYSALARMRLYQAAYGFSTDRLYATVFMAWLVVVFGWFCATVLRGRERAFLGGVLVSAWGFLAALNIADPAGLVMRANIARAERGHELDVGYAARLGADAAPALTRYLVSKPLSPPADWLRATADSASAASPVSISPPRAGARYVTSRDDFTARCYAARTLLDNWGPSASRDWRSWTVARAAALRAVATNEATLRTLAGAPASGVPYQPCPAPNVGPASNGPQ